LQNVSDGPAADDTSVILRLNDDGSTPSDNPFFGLGGNLARYYAYGIRNSFGLAFDPLTHKLWQTENGPDTYDEINIVEPGFNSGWVQIMGPEARSPQGLDRLFQVPGSHYTDPKFSWLDTVAPTAIVFLNSTQLGEAYQHDVFVGDINFGTLYHFEPTPSRDSLHFDTPALATDLVADPGDDLQEVIFGSGFEGITDLKVGPDGRLYILSFQGKIFAVSQEATLQGTVADTVSGAVLEGARVTAWRLDPPPLARVHTSTDASGVYIFGRLNPGRYWVFYTHSGYRPGVRHGDLPPGQTTTVNVQLPPRSATLGGKDKAR
jgi:glucose/sorbosone dehydrogenase/carboxypeptidase family protein